MSTLEYSESCSKQHVTWTLALECVSLAVSVKVCGAWHCSCHKSQTQHHTGHCVVSIPARPSTKRPDTAPPNQRLPLYHRRVSVTGPLTQTKVDHAFNSDNPLSTRQLYRQNISGYERTQRKEDFTHLSVPVCEFLGISQLYLYYHSLPHPLGQL